MVEEIASDGALTANGPVLVDFGLRRAQLARLPAPLRALSQPARPHRVTVADSLLRMAAGVDQRTHAGHSVWL